MSGPGRTVTRARTSSLVLLAMVGAGPASAQSTGWAHDAVLSRPRATVIGVAIRFPSGSADDEPGLEGTASVLARALRDQAEAALDPGAASVAVSVERSATTFTLLVTPSARERALQALAHVLFEAPLDAQAFERARAASLESHGFQAGSPVEEYRAEVALMLTDGDRSWSRPPVGTLASVRALTPAALEAFRGRHLRPGRAARVVVGPTPGTPGSAPDGAASGAAADSARAPEASTDPELPPDRDDGLAWTVPDRMDVVRDVTSAWITIAYPAPRSVRRTDLELLAHVLLEELDPTPPDPDRYSVDVRLEAPPGGPVLVVEAAVVPEAADRWERRIRDAVARVAETTLTPDFFRLRIRRFRAALALAEDRPESLAARVADDLLRRRRARDRLAEVGRLRPEDLTATAKSLGEPHVFRFGPDLTGSSGGGRPGG